MDSFPMLNVVIFCSSSGIEVDDEEAPVAVVAHSVPLKAKCLKAKGGAFSLIAPVTELVETSLNVEASSLMLPWMIIKTLICLEFCRRTFYDDCTFRIFLNQTIPWGDKNILEDFASGPIDSQLIESFPFHEGK